MMKKEQKKKFIIWETTGERLYSTGDMGEVLGRWKY